MLLCLYIEGVVLTVTSDRDRYRVVSNKRSPDSELEQSMIYRIRLEGRLGNQWAEWFGDVTITPDDYGETLLTCRVADQAALYGLLRKVRDLGLPLLSVCRLEPGAATEPDVGQ